MIAALQQKLTVVPVSIHFNDTLRLYLVVYDFFQSNNMHAAQHNRKATRIKLTKQYEGNVTVDDVLQ